MISSHFIIGKDNPFGKQSLILTILIQLDKRINQFMEFIIYILKKYCTFDKKKITKYPFRFSLLERKFSCIRLLIVICLLCTIVPWRSILKLSQLLWDCFFSSVMYKTCFSYVIRNLRNLKKISKQMKNKRLWN